MILESTTYPGTTRDVLIPELESGSGLKANQDFFVAYSPEREDPNNRDFSTSTIPKVIGADSEYSMECANTLYLSFINKTVTGFQYRGRRSDQTDGKHLPVRQHRAGQRIESHF